MGVALRPLPLPLSSRTFANIFAWLILVPDICVSSMNVDNKRTLPFGLFFQVHNLRHMTGEDGAMTFAMAERFDLFGPSLTIHLF